MIGCSGPRRWSMTYRYAVSPSSSKTTWNGDGRDSTTIASPGCNLCPSATPGGSVSFARASRRVAAVLVLRGLRLPLRRGRPRARVRRRRRTPTTIRAASSCSRSSWSRRPRAASSTASSSGTPKTWAGRQRRGGSSGDRARALVDVAGAEAQDGPPGGELRRVAAASSATVHGRPWMPSTSTTTPWSGQWKSTSRPSRCMFTSGSGRSSRRKASSAPLFVPALPIRCSSIARSSVARLCRPLQRAATSRIAGST